MHDSCFFFSDPHLTFAEGVEIFAGVETGCIHLDLFDNLTLICNVSKPEEVLPELTVNWLHNGTFRSEAMQLLNGGVTVTNTLEIDPSVVDDSGNYTCVAKLVIPESANITQSIIVEVIFKSEYILKGFHNFMIYFTSLS